jgi:hypothetical protein
MVSSGVCHPLTALLPSVHFLEERNCHGPPAAQIDNRQQYLVLQAAVIPVHRYNHTKGCSLMCAQVPTACSSPQSRHAHNACGQRHHTLAAGSNTAVAQQGVLLLCTQAASARPTMVVILVEDAHTTSSQQHHTWTTGSSTVVTHRCFAVMCTGCHIMPWRLLRM